MGGPWGYYAKWNKIEREKQILLNIDYMWILKRKSDRVEKCLPGPGACSGDREHLVEGKSFQL